MGRFINADAFVSTSQGLLGNNMFVYCGNNPIMRIDPSGNDYCAIDLSETADGGFFSFALTIPAVGIGSGVSELWDEFADKVTKSLSKADPTKTYRSDTEEHHIAAKRAIGARKAQHILNEVFPDGVESSYNKVILSTPLHRRIHNGVYYTVTNLLIVNAYESARNDKTLQYERVISALTTIAEILKGLEMFVPS